MSGSISNLSLQVHISKLERSTCKLKDLYRMLARQFLGIFCCEFLLTTMIIADTFSWFKSDLSRNLYTELYITQIVMQALLFMMWQTLFTIKRDRFLKQYYIANALCAELTDHADWTNFYMRDPGSITRRRLTFAVRDFNLIRTKSLFPELTPFNHYTYLTIVLNFLFIFTTILLFFQSESAGATAILHSFLW